MSDKPDEHLVDLMAWANGRSPVDVLPTIQAELIACLTTMHGFSQLMGQGALGPVPEPMVEPLKLVVAAAKRQRRILDELVQPVIHRLHVERRAREALAKNIDQDADCDAVDDDATRRAAHWVAAVAWADDHSVADAVHIAMRELRRCQTGLLGSLALLLDDDAQRSPEEVRMILQMVKQHAVHVGVVVTDVLSRNVLRRLGEAERVGREGGDSSPEV